MTDFRWRIVAALACLLAAAGLRFAHLGDWSLGHDELATLDETESLRHGAANPPTVTDRLPRMVPIHYALIAASESYFGTSEWSARLPAAIVGSLLPGFLVFAAWPRFGGKTAWMLGLTTALHPELVFQSQNARFYMTGAALTAVAAFAGEAAIRRNSSLGMAATSAIILVAAFTQTFLAGLFGLMFAAQIVSKRPTIGSRLPSWIVLIVGTAVCFVAMAIFVLPQLRDGWNGGQAWGYSTLRAIGGAVNQLGWATTVLAFAGGVLALARHRRDLRYWGWWMLAWIGSVVLLPSLVVYHPGYSVLFLIGPLVFATWFVGETAKSLPAPAAFAWIVGAVLLSLPSLVSHYADGSRPDFRAAAAYVAEHRRAEEKVAAEAAGYVRHYQPTLDPVLLTEAKLTEELQTLKEPTWIVLIVGRAGLPADAEVWLNANARLSTTFRKMRYDYSDFAIRVYRYPGLSR